MLLAISWLLQVAKNMLPSWLLILYIASPTQLFSRFVYWLGLSVND
jgi:hypothetical protein